MAQAKLTDREKILRAKKECERALREIKFGSNRAEVLGSATMSLCLILSTLDATRDDKTGILFVAAQIATEVQKQETKPYFPADGVQLQLGETIGVIDEQKGSNPVKKSGK